MIGLNPFKRACIHLYVVHYQNCSCTQCFDRSNQTNFLRATKMRRLQPHGNLYMAMK